MDEKDKKIARLEELLQSIKDNIDETESVLDSLSNSELQAENENDLPDDEFDRLLDEFIQSQLSEEETEDEDESDNSPSNTSHHIIFKNSFFDKYFFIVERTVFIFSNVYTINVGCLICYFTSAYVPKAMILE